MWCRYAAAGKESCLGKMPSVLDAPSRTSLCRSSTASQDAEIRPRPRAGYECSRLRACAGESMSGCLSYAIARFVLSRSAHLAHVFQKAVAQIDVVVDSTTQAD